MPSKNTLNDKRLTKKQVSEIIKTEGKLHQEYTSFFEEKYLSGYIKQDSVYELPGDRYLYVFDEKGMTAAGKGDIYPKEYFFKWMNWLQRVRNDQAHNRGNSVSHWMFYTKHKDYIIDHAQELVAELVKHLNTDLVKLDYSYESLDIISKKCQQYDEEKLFSEWYDNLVVYVGEVIKRRVNGFWDINKTHHDGAYPFISIDSKHIQYMPVNVVWHALNGINDIDLRKQTADEVRRNAIQAKLEKGSIS